MTSVFSWRGQPSVIRIKQTTRPTKKFAGLQDPTNHPLAISVTGARQGQIDTDRRDSIKRAMSTRAAQAAVEPCYFVVEGDKARAEREALEQ